MGKLLPQTVYHSLPEIATQIPRQIPKTAEVPPGPAYVELQRENELLKERLEYWRGQVMRTDKKTVRQRDVDRAVKKLLEKYNSIASAKDVSKAVKSLGDYIVGDGDRKNPLTWREAKDRAIEAAGTILEGNWGSSDEIGKRVCREILTQQKVQKRGIPACISRFMHRKDGRKIRCSAADESTKTIFPSAD